MQHTLINGTNMPAVKRREQHQQANCRLRRQAPHRNIARSYRNAHPFTPANIEAGKRSMRLIKLREPTRLTLRCTRLYRVHTTRTYMTRRATYRSRNKRVDDHTYIYISPVKPIHFHAQSERSRGHFVFRRVCRHLNALQRQHRAVWRRQFDRIPSRKSSIPNVPLRRVSFRVCDSRCIHETFVCRNAMHPQLRDLIGPARC